MGFSRTRFEEEVLLRRRRRLVSYEQTCYFGERLPSYESPNNGDHSKDEEGKANGGHTGVRGPLR